MGNVARILLKARFRFSFTTDSIFMLNMPPVMHCGIKGDDSTVCLLCFDFFFRYSPHDPLLHSLRYRMDGALGWGEGGKRIIFNSCKHSFLAHFSCVHCDYHN